MPKISENPAKHDKSSETKAKKNKAEAPPKPPKPSKKKQADPMSGRKVLYPEVSVNIGQGEDALTVQAAKDLIGWTTDKDVAAAAGIMDWTLKDEENNNVYLVNNCQNRPYTDAWSRALCQDILHSGPGVKLENRRWQFNLENIIISKTGIVKSGQHRIIALILASQIWAGPQKLHWQTIWPTEPVLETLIAFGASDESYVTRTLDNVRPRSFSDTLYTSPHFAHLKPGDRKGASKITEFAIRCLWQRTGLVKDPFAARRTHAECEDWINRHPKILKSVIHIWEEYQADWKNNSRFLPPGTAAGLCYLMGTSATDGEEYRNMDHPSERKVNWSMWDKAQEFWVLLCSNHPDVYAIRRKIGALANADGTGGGRMSEKIATIVKGWNLFCIKQKITEKALELRYHEEDDGFRTLLEHPSCGGLDLEVEDKVIRTKESDDEDAGDGDLSPEQLELLKQKQLESRGSDIEEKRKKLLENRRKKKEEEAVEEPEVEDEEAEDEEVELDEEASDENE